MYCHSNKIVRVTYPRNCQPELNESNDLIYSGPPLACIDGQTNASFNSIIKNLDNLLCETINKLTPPPPPPPPTPCLENQCWFNGGIAVIDPTDPSRVLIGVFPPIGSNMGDEFFILTNVGVASPNTATVDELFSGTFSITIDPNATTVTISSGHPCFESIKMLIIK